MVCNGAPSRSSSSNYNAHAEDQFDSGVINFDEVFQTFVPGKNQEEMAEKMLPSIYCHIRDSRRAMRSCRVRCDFDSKA